MTNAVNLASAAGTGFAFRNRIINGDMRVSQRFGASIVTNSTGYSVDRWATPLAGNGRYSAQQSTIAPDGFTNSLVHTVTTAVTPAAGDVYQLVQHIEGNNIYDFGWGSSSAKTATISFWVRSSIAGVYSLFIYNSGGSRSYVTTYTINAANTWEQKSIVIPGDTTGTWLTNNGIGIGIGWDLGSGSSYTTASSGWSSNTSFPPRRVSGSVNWIANSGATFYLTGVQFELGTVSTPYERRPLDLEQLLCMRYYQTYHVRKIVAVIYQPNGDTRHNLFNLPIPMRATPTIFPGTFSEHSINGGPSGVAINSPTNTFTATVHTTGMNQISFDFSSQGGLAYPDAVVYVGSHCDRTFAFNAEL